MGATFFFSRKRNQCFNKNSRQFFYPQFPRKFYRIKDQFLRRQDSSGRRVRHEVQACYSCDGDDPLCERCEGTGVYRERWLYTHAFTVGGVVYRMHSYTEPIHLLPGFGDDLESYGTAVSPTEYAELPLPFSPLLKMLAWVAATQWGMESGGNRYQSPPMDVRHYWVGL